MPLKPFLTVDSGETPGASSGSGNWQQYLNLNREGNDNDQFDLNVPPALYKRKIEREERNAGLTVVAEYTDKWKTGRRTEPDCELPE